MTRWYEQHSKAERAAMLDNLFELVRKGQLRAPWHEEILLQSAASDNELRENVTAAITKAMGGFCGGKQIFMFE